MQAPPAPGDPRLPCGRLRGGAAAQIGELAREPDRFEGRGQPHDADLDTGHFLDLDDKGGVKGGPKLAAMPRDRIDYETALRAGRDRQLQGRLSSITMWWRAGAIRN